MIYTVGKTEHYEKYFNDSSTWGPNGVPQKRGRRFREPGGTVWRRYSEAARYCAKNPEYSVYGVRASWKTDVENQSRADWGELGEWAELKIDADLVKLTNGLISPIIKKDYGPSVDIRKAFLQNSYL